MKKVLALLTALTMLFSVVPMVYADGEATVPSAYDELKAHEISFLTNDFSINSSEFTLLLTKAGSATFQVDFGSDASVLPVAAVVKSAHNANSYAAKTGLLNVFVGDELVGTVTPFDHGIFSANQYWDWAKAYFKVLKPEVCTGVQTVTLQATGDWGRIHSIEFCTQEELDAKLAEGTVKNTSLLPAHLPAYEDFTLAETWCKGLIKKGYRKYGVDFGTGKSSMALKISRTYKEATTAPELSVTLLDGTEIATIPEATAQANVAVEQMVNVRNVDKLTGVNVVKFSNEKDNVSGYSAQFIEIKNPYVNMLADGEVIEGDTWKTFKSVMFGENGTKSIDVTYTGAGTLYICEGENADEIFSAELPQATDATITLKIDDPSILAGFKDTFDIELGGSVTVSQIKFNENLLADQFAGATKVYVNYIGEGSDWYADIKTEFEEANAQDGRTFETDVIDMSAIFSTDFEKLNYVKSFTTDANIVFVQAGEYAKVILDNLVAMDKKPIVIVVGEADYADDYGISAITAGKNALKNEKNYKVPAEYVNPIYTTGLNLATATYAGGNPIVWNGAGYIGGVASYLGCTVKVPSVDFSEGAVAAVAELGINSDNQTQMYIRLDSKDGEILATYDSTPTGGYTSWKKVTKLIDKDISGVHDVWITFSDSAWAPFGNIKSIRFMKDTKSAYTTGIDFNEYATKTASAHNFSNSKLGALHPWPSYSQYPIDLPQGVSKITIKVDPSTEHNTKLDVKVGGIDGIVLATFDQNTSGAIAEQSVDVTSDITGVQDIYLYVYNTDGNDSSAWGKAFGDIHSVIFTPATEAEVEPITYTDSLTPANADSNELAQVNGNLFIANGESVTYSNVVFGEDEIKVLKANLAATEGTLTVTSGETKIAAFDLTNKSGNFENVMAISDVTLTGTMPFTFTYTGTNGCYLKDVEFVNLNAYSTTLNYTNYAEVDPGLENPDNASGWDRLPVTVDTNIGKFKSMIDNYIKWEGVNFGEEAKRATVEIGYANAAPYSGATISIYVDSISPENKIADTIAEAHHYDWNYRVSNTELVNRYITGYHDIYLVVNSNFESGYALNSNASADIFDVKFAEFTTADEYYVETKEIDRSYTNGEKWARDVKFSKQVTLSFVKGETSPESYMLIAAAYDVTTGALAGLETAQAETVDGLNVATVRLKYRDFGLGQYLFKYFVWDGETLKPLADGSDTLEVSEIVYPA